MVVLRVSDAVHVGAVDESARTHSYVALDLLPRLPDVVRQTGHLEYRLLVSTWRHDVSVRLLLDPLNGGSLRPDDQTDDPVRHPHLYRHLPRGGGARGAWYHRTP